MEWTEIYKGTFTDRAYTVVVPRLLLMMHDLEIKKQCVITSLELNPKKDGIDLICELDHKEYEVKLVMVESYTLKVFMKFKNEETKLSATSKMYDITSFIQQDVDSFNIFWNR